MRQGGNVSAIPQRLWLSAPSPAKAPSLLTPVTSFPFLGLLLLAISLQDLRRWEMVDPGRWRPPEHCVNQLPQSELWHEMGVGSLGDALRWEPVMQHRMQELPLVHHLLTSLQELSGCFYPVLCNLESGSSLERGLFSPFPPYGKPTPPCCPVPFSWDYLQISLRCSC